VDHEKRQVIIDKAVDSLAFVCRNLCDLSQKKLTHSQANKDVEMLDPIIYLIGFVSEIVDPRIKYAKLKELFVKSLKRVNPENLSYLPYYSKDHASENTLQMIT
jgi:hypothetical protein